jgi:hypothetical protein
MKLLCASTNRLSACGRALRPWLGRTLLPAAVLDPSGQASPAEGQPCRTAVARFTAARARGRARRRASSAAGAQIGNTGTFPGKPRRNGRACGRQYLRSAICATRSKGTRGPAVGYGPHRTIYLAGQTASMPLARSPRASARRRLTAALLHDSEEDQGGKARLDDVRNRFGEGLARIVSCTTRMLCRSVMRAAGQRARAPVVSAE